jgi:hypothetical protein
MFPLPISTYIYAGLILLSVVGFSYGRYEHNKYVTFKAEVEIAAKAQEAKVESIQKQHQLVTKGISDEYDAKLALIRQYYANGMRSPSSSSLSSIPDPTKPTSFIPTNNLLADCAQTTLMLTELQKWYLEVAGIK